MIDDRFENRKELVLEAMGHQDYKPLTDEEMVVLFGFIGKEAAELLAVIDELEENGYIFKTKKGKFVLPGEMGYLVGTLAKHRKGFGFVIPHNGEGSDVFIPMRGMSTALNGDIVAVKLDSEQEGGRARRGGHLKEARGGAGSAAKPEKLGKKGRPGKSSRAASSDAEETQSVTDPAVKTEKREGKIIRVIKRASDEIVGTFEQSKNFGFVVPDDPRMNDDIFIPGTGFGGAKKGDKVVAKITEWPKKDRNPEGVVTEIVSRQGEARGDIKSLIRQYNLTDEFPEAVLEEAAAVPQTIAPEELVRREDLRGKRILTMDGADAKDLDDAISIERNQAGNYVLGVHIADVSHYVREGSALDREAVKRGCSVYLIDKVIPMLPETLSNGICSLNMGVDRLTLSVEMEIDGRGTVVGHRVFESVIHSDARMVYDDVSDMIEKKDELLIEKYKELYPDILLMNELKEILSARRDRRGGLDFDFDEAYIKLNKEGVPVSVDVASRRIANSIIEEFMLVANETVAEHFYWLELPFVYRVHEKPSLEKMEEFKRFLMGFGCSLKGSTDNIHPRALNEVLKKFEGKPEENIVNTVMLRSMKKAFYGTDCEGHFGLGVKFYSHFTSPIRRYPDLIIHRIIKESLTGGKFSDKRYGALKKLTEEACVISSAAERKAEELERDVEKLKKAEYMADRIGEVYDGIISGVASFGFFVEIGNTIEGLVRADGLIDDFYQYEPDKYRLYGRRTRKIYRLGDKVSIEVKSVDLANREINFMLA